MWSRLSGVRLLTLLAPGHQHALRRVRGMVRWCSLMRSITKAVAPLIIGFCSVSCSTTPSSDADAAWLAEGGARLLADVFRSVDLQVVREGKHLSVAGKRIDVDALVENRAQRSGQEILAAAFRITIGGSLWRLASVASTEWYRPRFSRNSRRSGGPTGRLISFTRCSSQKLPTRCELRPAVKHHGPPNRTMWRALKTSLSMASQPSASGTVGDLSAHIQRLLAAHAGSSLVVEVTELKEAFL
jgi:hypothetical protein